MVKDSELLKCMNCGQVYHPDSQTNKKSMICMGCGLRLIPLIGDKTSKSDFRTLYLLLGFSSIIALIGALGGIMAINGWNFWVTFTIIGGIIFLLNKIFLSKYKIGEINDYYSDETLQRNMNVEHITNFDRLIFDAINELPENLKKHLSNISIVVQDKPDSRIIEKLRLKSNTHLLGLFEGIPLNKKSVWHSSSMPERITIYQKNIEAYCHSEEEVKRRVKNVVLHEVAHFFGFTEKEIRKEGY